MCAAAASARCTATSSRSCSHATRGARSRCSRCRRACSARSRRPRLGSVHSRTSRHGTANVVLQATDGCCSPRRPSCRSSTRAAAADAALTFSAIGARRRDLSHRRMIRAALRHPHAVAVASLALVLLGGTAATLIPTDLLPQFRTPAVQIVTFYPGMPAEVMERTSPPGSSAGPARPTASRGRIEVDARRVGGEGLLPRRRRPNAAMAQVATSPRPTCSTCRPARSRRW